MIATGIEGFRACNSAERDEEGQMWSGKGRNSFCETYKPRARSRRRKTPKRMPLKAACYTLAHQRQLSSFSSSLVCSGHERVAAQG